MPAEQSQPRIPAPGEPGPTPVGRGALSALLEDLARAPRPALDEMGLALRPGQTLGRYQVLREIGRGGFGVVYEARDVELGRLVALKTVRARRHDPQQTAMLRQEAEAAAQLNHPNIVTLHDAGLAEGAAFLVMERLHGETLEARLERGPLPPREAVGIAAEVARGLAHAHAAGVLHRDLKPSNVLLTTDGGAKILDFGLSRVFGSDSGEKGGTPGYMAPEQWRGEADDQRTDLFALGVMLHQMLTGRLPYEVKEGRSAALDPGPPPPLDGLPREVRPFLERALSRDPAGRPRSARAALEALLAAERALSGAGAPRRRRLLWAAAAVLALALLGAAALRLRARPVAQPGRIPVAVADFANETGEPDLSGLSGMLTTSLEQSRHLQVLTRARMFDLLRQMGKEPAARLDEVAGRELGRKAGVQALVLATIRRFDQVYAIEMQVLDPVTDEYLFAVKEQGTGKSSIPGLIDRLSEQIRQRLREAPAEVEASRVKVAEATTASLEAYEHYFRGQQQEERTRYDSAIAEFREALRADPNFALAHYQIAYLGEFVGLEPGERQKHIEAAVANSSRVGEKERLLIRAWQAHMEKRNEEAHRLYARAVEAWPQEKEVLYMAADLYFHEYGFVEALPLFERALQLDPTWEPALIHLTDCLAALGRREELLARSRRWVELAPGPASYRALASALARNGKVDEALPNARRAYQLEPNFWSLRVLGDVLLNLGAYAEVEALVRPVMAHPADSGLHVRERVYAFAAHACALALQGRRREALQALEALRESPAALMAYHEARMNHFFGDGALDKARVDLEAFVAAARKEGKHGDRKWREQLPTWTALVGDLAGAAELARSLEPGSPAEAFYRGVVGWRSGRLDEAAAALRPLSERTDDYRATASYLLGEVEVARGHDADGLSALERFRGTFRDDYWMTWSVPRSLLAEARALEGLGRRAEARDKVTSLLEAWKRGDPDSPIMKEARALAEKLRDKTAARQP